MSAVPLNPDCAAAKHGACSGTSWNDDLSDVVACPCECHAIASSHFRALARVVTGQEKP